MDKINVLFVCLGNICRSPLAEAVFKHKIKERGLESSFYADSCGTANYHIGDSPDPRTITNAKRNGVIIEHCGRQLGVEDIATFDYIMAMDNSNLKNILKLLEHEDHRGKILLMREFDPIAKGEVPDPYYGGEKGFQEVFDILDRTMDNFIDFLVEKHLANPKSQIPKSK